MTTNKKGLQEVAQPLSQGEKNFKNLHNPVKAEKLVPGVTDQDHVFKGSTKPYDNKFVNSNNPPKDIEVYDKTLKVDDNKTKLGYEKPTVGEATLSPKAARAGKDIGAKGKYFNMIAKNAAERYGSKEAGKKVAGAVLAKMRAKVMHKEEVEQVDEMPSPRALDKGTRNATIDAASKNSKFKGMKGYKQPGEMSKAQMRNDTINTPGYKEALAKRGLKEAGDITDEELSEALTKSSKAADWIHDFVHSDNPKFAGKSTKERQKMALAAYYAKQNEEVIKEDVDFDYEGEMAKTELRAICHKANELADMMSDDMQLEAWLQSKISRAKDQIDAVYDYLMFKDHDNQDDDTPVAVMMAPAQSPMASTYGSFLNRMGEEIEQVDEVSSMTKKNYADKASADLVSMHKKTWSKDAPKTPEEKYMFVKKITNRLKGIQRATKEEVEHIEKKEKDLAALAEPKDKITMKDVLVGRGVLSPDGKLIKKTNKK